MRNITPLLFLLALSFYSSAQNCLNAGLENGTLEGYTTYFGNIMEDGTVVVDQQGFKPKQHMIMHVSDGMDLIAKNFCEKNKYLPVVPPEGGDYTLRLGNDSIGAEAEKVVLRFKVTPELTFFQLRYAVVLYDPDHLPFEQPRFEMRIKDEFGNQLDCGEYKVRAAADIPGFETCRDGWRIRPWTTVGFELKSFLGQNIQIEFLTTDCARTQHAGYAYLDATCEPLTIQLEGYCPENITAFMRVTEGFADYRWNTGDSTSTISIQNPQPNDEYRVTVTSATGCTVVLKETVPDNNTFAIPSFTTEPDQTYCRDTSFMFTPRGENLRNIYSTTHNKTGTSFLIDTKETTIYTFISKEPKGCFEDTLIFKILEDSLYIQAVVDSIPCYGEEGSISISANSNTPPFQYEWKHGATTSIIDQLPQGKYTVTVSDQNNCTNIATFDLASPSPFLVELLKEKPFSCYDNPNGQLTLVPIGGSPPYEILWDNGKRNTTDLLQLPAGDYAATLTDANGCIVEKSAFIDEISPPTLTSRVTSVSCYGRNDGAIDLSISGRLTPYEIQWQDDLQLTSPFRDNLPAGEYFVVIEDNVGCIKDTSFLIKEPPLNTNCGIYIPTAFSPNGNGVNDVFFIQGIEGGRTIESMDIFDRWGNLVFQNKGNCTSIGDNSCGWNGKINSQDAPSGVYVYLIKIQAINGDQTVLYYGDFLLTR